MDLGAKQLHDVLLSRAGATARCCDCTEHLADDICLVLIFLAWLQPNALNKSCCG